MKRSKNKKADVITAILWALFFMLVAAAAFGLGKLGYALLGTTVGNSYYASLADQMRPNDTVNFTALHASNPQIKAWVTLPNTAVDLPIAQTSDNAFYLTHRFDGKKNKLGTPFIDAANAGDFSDRHTVIYGHAVKSGALFGSLWEYENPNYYKRHTSMTLYLPDGTQRTLTVFACARVPGVRSYVPVSFSGDDAFLGYVNELRSLSAFDSGVTVSASDRIVSFCVCPQGDERVRLLVSCVAGSGAPTETITIDPTGGS